ncbi:MAG TPA: hypothetical protein VD927_06350 [Chryseosolibacter sp.]|nr:hypothetical protein [Chryseosolibacter sp.]
MDDKLKRFFEIIGRMNADLNVSDEDYAFALEYSPEINQKALDDFVKANKEGTATQEQYQAAIFEWARKVQSDPVQKERAVKLSIDKEGQELSGKLRDGLSLVLGGVDIANSINQIREGDRAARRSRRPSKPAVPQRDALLAQALREAEEGTFDGERAVAATRAQIQDQYQNDIANAKTASTGQAGAYGAYAQLAANRRNRASLQLAPIQDQIRAREQQRYDNLLGMRMDETQRMFDNQSSTYGLDLYQYGQDQQAAAALGSTGRSNLRNSLYGFAGNVADISGKLSADRRFRNLQNRLKATYGDETGDNMYKINENTFKYTNPDIYRKMIEGGTF